MMSRVRIVGGKRESISELGNGTRLLGNSVSVYSLVSWLPAGEVKLSSKFKTLRCY